MIPSTSLFIFPGQGLVVSLSPQSEIGTTSSGYRISNNGGVYTAVDGAYILVESWLISGLTSDFEVRAVKLSGNNITAGTLNTWLSTTSTNSWELVSVMGSFKTTQLQITIRDADTLEELAQETITLTTDNS